MKYANSSTQAGSVLVKSFPDGSSVVTDSYNEAITFGEGTSNPITLSAPVGAPYYGNLYIAKYYPDGSINWVRSIVNSTEYGDPSIGSGLATLADGSIIISGGSESTLTFGTGEANQTILTNSNPSGDLFMFVAKYNADGSLAWAKKAAATTDFLWVGDMTGLADGSTIIIGSAKDTTTFGLGETNQTILTETVSDINSRDTFIAKYNVDGSLAWAKHIGPGGSFNADTISIDSMIDGSFVVMGRFDGITTFGAGDINQTVLTSTNGRTDMFLAKYNVDGSLSWVKQAAGVDIGPEQMRAFPDGSSVITGYCRDLTTFGKGEANQTIITCGGGRGGMFIAKYNSNGNLVWVRDVVMQGSNVNSSGYSISTFSDSSFIVGAKIGGNENWSGIFGAGYPGEIILTGNAGISREVIVKYNAEGTLAE